MHAYLLWHMTCQPIFQIIMFLSWEGDNRKVNLFSSTPCVNLASFRGGMILFIMMKA
jgi:hypothetical protein